MLSIQETVQKDEVKEQLKLIEKCMDHYGMFHPDMSLGKNGQPCGILNVPSGALKLQLQETLQQTPLKEFLAKSGSTGIGGAAYLVPDKIHVDLVAYSGVTDIVPLISAQVVDGWEGGDLKVAIASDEDLKPQFSSGATIPTETVGPVEQATVSPKSFGLDCRIGSDLIDDQAYDLIDMHIRKTAWALGEHASDMALTVLKTGTDGVGTVNGGATGDGDETKWLGATTDDINDLKTYLTDDRWIGNTMVITTEAWEHSVQSTMPTLANNIPVQYDMPPTANGFDCKLGIPPLDVKFYNCPTLCNNEFRGAAMTNCVTIVFDRNNALLTGRKRWMRLENYALPKDDLAGLVVTCRQDSVSLYNDAIAKSTED